jgi:hypothetical protein
MGLHVTGVDKKCNFLFRDVKYKTILGRFFFFFFFLNGSTALVGPLFSFLIYFSTIGRTP